MSGGIDLLVFMENLESRIRHRSVRAASTRVSDFNQFHLLGWTGMESTVGEQETGHGSEVVVPSEGDPNSLVMEEVLQMEENSNMATVSFRGNNVGPADKQPGAQHLGGLPLCVYWLVRGRVLTVL